MVGHFRLPGQWRRQSPHHHPFHLEESAGSNGAWEKSMATARTTSLKPSGPFVSIIAIHACISRVPSWIHKLQEHFGVLLMRFPTSDSSAEVQSTSSIGPENPMLHVCHVCHVCPSFLHPGLFTVLQNALGQHKERLRNAPCRHTNVLFF